MLLVAIDRQPQIIGAVERLGIQMRERRGFLAVHNLYMRRAGVVPLQAVMQLLAGHAGRQQAQLQRNRQHDALAERAVRGHEHGTLRQARVRFDFRRVLVRQTQSVQLERRTFRAVRPFIGVHAGAATSRIARHRMHHGRVVGRHQPGLDQGAQQGDGARPPAPRPSRESRTPSRVWCDAPSWRRSPAPSGSRRTPRPGGPARRAGTGWPRRWR
ncbi:hypothetical protein G6F65_019815 [Rhizopus arrhizus]|nr:hypothetical protein G6F65_019815 [Rhizopus arrhizus]